MRSSAWRRWGALVVCALAFGLPVAVAGCGSDDSAEDAAAARRRAAAAAAHARAIEVGRRAFAEHCQSCHTIAGKHYTGEIIEFEAPSLDEVKPRRHYVQYRAENGGPAMASFAHEMPRSVLSALVTYVTETAGRNVRDNGEEQPDQVAAGREVFAAHCAVCHGIAGRAMLGRPLYPGIDFNLVKPSERLVKSIIRRGLLTEVVDAVMMPSFRGKLTDEQIDAVAAYVTAVAAEGPEAPASPTE